jgi:hypothetical protein
MMSANDNNMNLGATTPGIIAQVKSVLRSMLYARKKSFQVYDTKQRSHPV